jgi:signal transduction histidine kinase
VAQERLGLFDTPASPREIRFAAAAAGLLVAAFIVVVPFSSIRLGEADSFVPVTEAVIFVGELIIATMLYAQAAIFHSRALTVLASSFVFGALLLVPHALTFPGAFAPGGLFEPGLNGTAWIMIFRRTAMPLAIIVYAGLEWAESKAPPDVRRPPQRVLLWVAAAAVLAAAATMVSIRGGALLPAMFVNRTEAHYLNLTIFNISNIVLIVIAMTLLILKRTSVLDVWLLVALASWAIQLVLNLTLHARFTLGWYCLFVVVVVSNLFMLLALIGESNRLYARLALSTGAQSREREARMMTMDAVAAAISHEVGQPLAAVTLSAAAGLNSLTRNPPDRDMAIKSLRDAIDAGRRTFDVLRSVRSTYSRGAGSMSEFQLNELLLETASLLGREFSARRISLELSLDRDLPPILANRVQIHRVLVNLLTNGIESIDAAGRRSRRITIRSAVPDKENVLLEIRDTGAGIPDDDIERIFDPFFTTKSSGTGLGLSLSSTIVEEHGGRLWASSGELGATFHLRLRRHPVAGDAMWSV